MTLKRKLLAGGAAVLLVAGGVSGAALAAGWGTPPTRSAHRSVALYVTQAGLVSVSAGYLRIDTATLRRELRSGRTLAAVAATAPGRSTHGLIKVLDRVATSRLLGARALGPEQQQTLVRWLRRRITSFVNGTSALQLAGIEQHLIGCGGRMLME